MSKRAVIAGLLAITMGALAPLSAEAHGKRHHGVHHGHRVHGHHGYRHRYHPPRPKRHFHRRHHVPYRKPYHRQHYDPFAALITYGLVHSLEQRAHKGPKRPHRAYRAHRKPHRSPRRHHRRRH